MLKAAAFIGLIAAAAMLANADTNVPFGNSFVNIQGILEPIASAVGNIPSYIIKNVMNGAAFAKDIVNFTCSRVANTPVQLGNTFVNPVVMCRNAFTGAPATSFLLSAEQLALPETIRNFNLALSMNIWQRLQQTQGAVQSLSRPFVPLLVPGPNFVKIFSIPYPF